MSFRDSQFSDHLIFSIKEKLEAKDPESYWLSFLEKVKRILFEKHEAAKPCGILKSIRRKESVAPQTRKGSFIYRLRDVFGSG